MSDVYRLFGIDWNSDVKSDVLLWMRQRLRTGQATYMVTPNPEMVMCLQSDMRFERALSQADMRVADGVGIQWASRFLALPDLGRGLLRKCCTILQFMWTGALVVLYPPYIQKYIPRIPGADLFWDLMRLCAEEKKRPFFLGAAPGVAEKVREKVLALYPDMQVAGVYSGSSDPEADEETRHYIESSQADVVCIAFSFPQQELWMQRNVDRFKTGKFMIGLGGTFDFVSGLKKRAPRWLRRLGLEWLFRLLYEPWRYIRIYTATIRFMRFVFKAKLMN